MRTGLLGGTFDPIHCAHLEVAQAAAEQCRLDRVLLVPAANPPHRAAVASYRERLEMVEIACAGSSNLIASTLDNAPGKSYSINTVERLRSTLSPGQQIYFLIGADAFAELKSWHRWSDLAALVTFAVISRPGAIYEDPLGVSVHRVTGIHLTISSSEIRGKLAAGDSPAGLPPGVLDYVREHHLYGFA